MGKLSFKKNKRLLALMVVAGVMISSAMPSTKAFATGKGIGGSELTSLGNHKTYNAVVFGNHTAEKADIEGQLAVGGNITAPTDSNNYGIGAAFNGNSVVVGHWITDTTTPTFLLGGTINKTEGKITLEAGTAAIGSKANKEYIYPGMKYQGVVEANDSDIAKTFADMKSTVNALINKAKSYAPSNKAVENANYGVVESNEDSKVLVNTVGRNEKSLIINGTGHSTNLPNLSDKDFYIFYSDAEEVRFEKDFYYNNEIAYSRNMKELGIAGKILWVFPNAKKVTTIANDVPGSIVCPNAELYLHGGSINGQVFTKDLNQVKGSINGATGVGGEVHNFRFDWDKWNNDTVETPEKPAEEENKPEEGTPDNEEQTPSEEVPGDEVTEEGDKEETPSEETESDNEKEEATEEENEEGSLPKTGGIAAVTLAILGVACTVGGIYLSKRKK